MRSLRARDAPVWTPFRSHIADGGVFKKLATDHGVWYYHPDRHRSRSSVRDEARQGIRPLLGPETNDRVGGRLGRKALRPRTAFVSPVLSARPTASFDEDRKICSCGKRILCPPVEIAYARRSGQPLEARKSAASRVFARSGHLAPTPPSRLARRHRGRGRRVSTRRGGR